MKLIAWRQATDTSREEVARAIGTTRVTVFRWETGQTVPDLAMIAKIDDLTGGKVKGNDWVDDLRERRTGCA